MILTKTELLALKPLLFLIAENDALNLTLHIAEPANTSEHKRKVIVDLSCAGTYVKAHRHGGPPEVEFYRTLMGLAMAYKVPLSVIINRSEGD